MGNAARRYDPRKAMIAAVKISQKQLGLEDGDYRALLVRVTGHASSTACTVAQLGDVLDALKGRSRPAPAATKRADHPAAGKARALWISLHRLGVVRDGAESALEAFARRQLGVDRLQWADQGQVFKLIEALKAMAERAGWSQDLAGVARGDQVATLRARLEVAIAARAETP
jgi:phage gp16-like protein